MILLASSQYHYFNNAFKSDGQAHVSGDSSLFCHQFFLKNLNNKRIIAKLK